MEEQKHRKILYAALGIIFFFSFLGQCNSRSAKKLGISNEKKLDSIALVISNIKDDTKELKNLEKTIKIEGLKTEKSTLLNTNQIFLTNKRPDQRVIEIDKEIERLENK